MPLQATSGAASYDAFGGGVVAEPNYIESCFSTYLYTGNDSTINVNNGIDLAGKGGLVWLKNRTAAASHQWFDTLRGVNIALKSNSTAQNGSEPVGVNTFNSNGFIVGGAFGDGPFNLSGNNYVSWTFRKQPKFFDVVTYTGNGATNRQIAHSLGSVPGCIIIKCTSATGLWYVWHKDLTGNSSTGPGLYLNLTTVYPSDSSVFNQTQGATTFSISPTGGGNINDAGATYVAYLFAHDAGGFGATGTDNVVSCGSFTTSSIGLATVDLGYEPQWILYKGSNGVTNWQLVDNMRGFVVGAANSGTSFLNANTSAAEGTNPPVGITNTGFNFDGAANITFIYIAIRRGPMKVPTDGTKVFQAGLYTGDNDKEVVNTGANSISDLVLMKPRTSTSYNDYIAQTMLTNRMLKTNLTDAEVGGVFDNYLSTGFTIGNSQRVNASGVPYVYQAFRRAPGFFDEVCWTGDGTNPRSLSHNLTVAPTLIITKKRNSTSNWTTGYDFAPTTYKYFYLNDTGSATSDTYVSSPVYGGNPTTSVFIVGNQGNMNVSGDTYVSYLFATCPGVQYINSYVGDGTTGRTINCGFTGGARFVCIKATSTTGSWWTFDSARGIVTNNDPVLQLNSTAAEITSADAIDPASSGFIVNQEATCSLNASGVSYLVWAIA